MEEALTLVAIYPGRVRCIPVRAVFNKQLNGFWSADPIASPVSLLFWRESEGDCGLQLSYQNCCLQSSSQCYLCIALLARPRLSFNARISGLFSNIKSLFGFWLSFWCCHRIPLDKMSIPSWISIGSCVGHQELKWLGWHQTGDLPSLALCSSTSS